MRWWGIAAVALALCAGVMSVQPARAQNLAAAANGGKVVSWTSQEDAKSWAAVNLIDGQRRKIGSSWSSPLTGGAVPQEIVIELPGGQPVEIDKVVVSLNTGPPFLYSEFWAKDVTVLVSAAGSTPQEFTPVAQAALTKSEGDQAIAFGAAPARFVKLRIDSAQSATAPHVELAEVEVYAKGTGPATEVVPAAAPPAAETTPAPTPPVVPTGPAPTPPAGVTAGDGGPALPTTLAGGAAAPGATGPTISTTPDPNAPVAGPVPPTGVAVPPTPPVTVPSIPAAPGTVAPGPGTASGLGPAPTPAPAAPGGAGTTAPAPAPEVTPPVVPTVPTPPVETAPTPPPVTAPTPPAVTTVAPDVPQPTPTAPQPPTESLAAMPADAPAFVDPGTEAAPTPTVQPTAPVAPTPGPSGEAPVSAPADGGTAPAVPTPTAPEVAPTPPEVAPTPPTTPTAPTAPPEPVAYAGPVKNLAAQSAGGTVMASTFVNEEFSNTRLNNGIRGVDADEEVWTSAANPKYPHDLVASFANGEVHMVSKVTTCGPGMLDLFGDRMPKDVEVWVSTTDTNDESFTKAASAQLKMVSEDQAIEFQPVAAKYVKLRILSNHGAPRFVELSEFEVWGDPAPVSAAAAAPVAPTAPAEAPPAEAPPAPAVVETPPTAEPAPTAPAPETPGGEAAAPPESPTVPEVPTDIEDPAQLDKLIRDIEDVLARLRALRQAQPGG